MNAALGSNSAGLHSCIMTTKGIVYIKAPCGPHRAQEECYTGRHRPQKELLQSRRPVLADPIVSYSELLFSVTLAQFTTQAMNPSANACSFFCCHSVDHRDWWTDVLVATRLVLVQGGLFGCLLFNTCFIEICACVCVLCDI